MLDQLKSVIASAKTVEINEPGGGGVRLGVVFNHDNAKPQNYLRRNFLREKLLQFNWVV